MAARPRLGTQVLATREGCLDRASTRAVRARIEQIVAAWYRRGGLTGYWVVPIIDAEDLDEYGLEVDRTLLPPDWTVPPPLAYVHVTYDLDSDRRPSAEELAAFAREFRMELLAEAP